MIGNPHTFMEKHIAYKHWLTTIVTGKILTNYQVTDSSQCKNYNTYLTKIHTPCSTVYIHLQQQPFFLLSFQERISSCHDTLTCKLCPVNYPSIPYKSINHPMLKIKEETTRDFPRNNNYLYYN